MKPALFAMIFVASTIDAIAAVRNPISTVAPHPPTAEEIHSTVRDGSRLFLQSGIIDPTRQRIDFAAIGLERQHRIQQLTSRPAAELAIIQLKPGNATAKSDLESLGVELLGYIPDNAYIVRIDRSTRAAVAERPFVRWMGDLEPGHKVSPRLWPGSPVTDAEIIVHAFPGVSLDAIFFALKAEFPEIVRTLTVEDAVAPMQRIAIPFAARKAIIETAANLDGVRWLEPYDEPELHNTDSLGPIQGSADGVAGRTMFAHGIHGTGQIVAVADTGLDADMCFFRNLNGVVAVTTASSPAKGEVGSLFPNNKVIAYWVQEGAAAYDTDNECPSTERSASYHGTHVSGSIAGDNSANPSSPTTSGVDPGDGMAPNAQLLFQDVGGAFGCLNGLGDRASIFEQARRGGARIHSNSTGASTNGTYTANDQVVDRFLFDHDEMAILTSAGNTGPGGKSIGSPAVSKNAITVGALGHGDSRTAAAFSSRGPTADGRIKPDIVAPGVKISSASGDFSIETNNCGVADKQGTSMSTPTVAGGAALVRQYFAEGYYPGGAANANDSVNVTASLLKALLLNGTLALPETGGFGDFAYGWGRVFLDGNLFFPGDTRDVRVWNPPNTNGLKTGDTSTFSVRIPAGSEFRTTLVWNDPEGSFGAASLLVNDLDLSVITPSGVTLFGNVFTAAGDSTAGGEADRLNNVEQIRVIAPADGIYTIRVNGTNVPGNGRALTDRQGYALVASSSQCATGVNAAPTLVKGTTTVGRLGVDLEIAAAASSKLTQVYRTDGSCSAPVGDFRFIGSTTGTSFTDTRAQGGVTYAYRLRGADDCGEGPVSSCVSVTATGSCDLAPTFAGAAKATADGNNCRINVEWPAGATNCVLAQTVLYNIYRSTEPDFVPTGAPYATVTGATSFSDISVVSGETYYYIVRAEDNVVGASGPHGGNEEKNITRVFATAFGAPAQTGTWTDDGGDTNAYLLTDKPWQLTQQTAQSGPRAYRSAEAALYPDLTCAAATTPSLTLEANAQLKYFARYNLEHEWDGVIVEISTDGGNTWSDLPPSGGYPGTLAQTTEPPINQCGYPRTHGAFTGPVKNEGLTDWAEYSSSLSAFAGQTVKIRWRLTTDPGAEFDGFFLDTISVTNVKLPGACDVVAIQPVASFTYTPRAPVVGTPVRFTDSSSNEPASWLWELGDGTTSTERNPSHTYTTAGLKTVRLTVTNPAGSSSSTREITIGDPAATYTAQLLVPTAARAQGAGGSFFRTSLWLTNTATTDSVVRLRFVTSGSTGNAETTALVQIPAHRSIAFTDVLTDAFGATASTSGTILVEVQTGRPTPIVTSRTFNDAGEKGTFGQYIPAIPLTGSTSAAIDGLGADTANRTNVGVTNLTSSPISATITVLDANGAVINTLPVVTVDPFGFQQRGVGGGSVFGVRIAANGNFFGYASKLDNKTSDPIFVPGTLVPRSMQWIDGVGSLTGANNTRFRSSLFLTNRGTEPATVTIAIVPRGQTAPTTTTTVIVAAGATRSYSDATQELFGFSGAATLTFTTSPSTPIVAWARTYSDMGAEGTLGQFIPAWSTEDLIGARGAILQGLSQNAGYRTNGGLINTSSVPVAVTISVWKGDGTKAGTKVFTPLGGQSQSLSQVLRDITGSDITDGYLEVVPAVPGAIYAWASFVDNRSTDQTFVRPIPIP